MKKVFAFIIFALIFAPCLLVANENDNLWVNFVGFFYGVGLYLISKTKVAKKWLKMLNKAMGLTYNNNNDNLYE